MDKEFKNYPDIAPVMGAYSRATKVGNTFYMAGCTAGDSTAPLSDQVRVTLEKIKGVMEAEDEGSAGAQDTKHLGEGEIGVLHVVQRVEGEREVLRLVFDLRQLLDVALEERDERALALGEAEAPLRAGPVHRAQPQVVCRRAAHQH